LRMSSRPTDSFPEHNTEDQKYIQLYEIEEACG
jgi:hypothetical protein